MKIEQIQKLPLFYYSEPSAWMKADILNDYLSKINDQMIEQNRRILFLFDQSAAHEQYSFFSNIEISFLPPNTNSKLQPMEAGVIQVFKGYYKIKLARKLISFIEAGQKANSKAVNLFQAIEMATSSWADIKDELIMNCFKECGFYKSKLKAEPIETALIEKELENLRNMFNSLDESYDFDKFCSVDDKLATSEPLNEIGLKVEPLVYEPEEKKNEVEREPDPELVRRCDVVCYLDKIRLFALQRENQSMTDELLSQINKMEKTIFSESKK